MSKATPAGGDGAAGEGGEEEEEEEEKGEGPKEDSRLLPENKEEGEAGDSTPGEWDTDSVPNGSSSCNITIMLDPEGADPPAGLHPDYLRPLPLSHPLEENVIVAFARGCLFYFVGFLVGFPLIFLLALLAIVILPFRVLGYLLTRLSCRGMMDQILHKQHCDPWWPMHLDRYEDRLSSVVHCVATIQGHLPQPELQQLLWKKLINLQSAGGFMKYPRYSQLIRSNSCSHLFRNWSQDQNFDLESRVRQLQGKEAGGEWSLKRFEEELNRLEGLPLDPERPLWSVEVIPEFGESRCTLLVFRLHSLLVDRLCVPRMFCMLNDAALSFEVEPKLRGNVLPPFNIFVSISYTLWTWCQTLTAGPLSLLMAGFKRRDPIWSALEESKRKKSVVSDSSKPAKFRRSAGSTNAARSRRSPSLLSTSVAYNPNAHRRLTWARVPNLDKLLRAERILRSTTLELLLTFIAGSFRRYFRSQGIRHPTDLQISIPVSSREFIPIGKHHPCRFSLVPFLLPVSVEGCIPRLWEVQRSIGDALEGAYPQAFRAFRTIGDLIFPSSITRRVLLRTHGGSSCALTFIRCSGELSLSSRRIHSMLLYQPVIPDIKATFTFVQNGHEMVVSLMVDQRFFPDPDVLLTGFQNELQGLLQQLSVRMLTLSQATFLPSPLISKFPPPRSGGQVPPRSPGKVVSQVVRRPSSGLHNEESDFVGPTRSTSQDKLSVPSYAEMAEGVRVGEGNETLEELEELLGRVQREMDGLRDNPRGDRAEALQRLSELEEKMEKFHRSIAERLHKDAQLAGKRASGVELEGPAGVEALLQPYKDEATGVGGSGSRRDSGFKLKRKRSKRMDSPTRISPKPSRVWDEP